MSRDDDADVELAYEDVLEYLSDRAGDPLTFQSHPTFGGGGEPTLLGLSLPVWLVDVTAVSPFEDAWLDGAAGARILLAGVDTDLRKWNTLRPTTVVSC